MPVVIKPLIKWINGPTAGRIGKPRRDPRGLLDTSAVIDLDQLDPELLPDEVVVSALTMAELAAGPHAAGDSAERARRQDRLQRAEATFHPLPFDSAAAPEGPGPRTQPRQNRSTTSNSTR